MADDWVEQLSQLNRRIRDVLSDAVLGNKAQRRDMLQQGGTIRRLNRLTGAALANVLEGGLMVGVDGTVNTVGGQFPYYVDFLRAVAKPSAGQSVVVKALHCPLPPDDEAEEVALRNDNQLRQEKLAALEVEAAIAAIDKFRPKLVLMDGPLVRFDMRAKDSFLVLCEKVIRNRIALIGCIENIESKVLSTLLGDQAPAGWRNRYDRDLLWDTLDYGEVLELRRPAKGLPRQEPGEQAVPICTWFVRGSLDPAVIGLDMLASQVDQAGQYVDYLFSLSPSDGRGIPIWLDLVDREVRLTDAELEAYAQLLDPQVRRILHSKRVERFF